MANNSPTFDDVVVLHNLQLCQEYYEQIRDVFGHLPNLIRRNKIVIATKRCHSALGGNKNAHCHGHSKPHKICIARKTLLAERHKIAWIPNGTENPWHELSFIEWLKYLMAHEAAHIRTKGSHGKAFKIKFAKYYSVFK